MHKEYYMPRRDGEFPQAKNIKEQSVVNQMLWKLNSIVKCAIAARDLVRQSLVVKQLNGEYDMKRSNFIFKT